MQKACHEATSAKVLPPISQTSPAGCTVPAAMAKSFTLGQVPGHPVKTWTARIQEVTAPSGFGGRCSQHSRYCQIQHKFADLWIVGARLVLIRLRDELGRFPKARAVQNPSPLWVSESQHLSSSYSFEHLATSKPEFIRASKHSLGLKGNCSLYCGCICSIYQEDPSKQLWPNTRLQAPAC